MINIELKENESKPILFNTEMIRAILKDSERYKTLTRRVVKPQPIPLNDNSNNTSIYDTNHWYIYGSYVHAPYEKGGILWVRETHKPVSGLPNYIYRADIPEERWKDYRWSPSIHMPKKACRLWLKVLDIRVERLQDITEDDAIKEGIELDMNTWYNEIRRSEANFKRATLDMFKLYWNYIDKKTNGIYNVESGWLANPWVWRIKFEKVKEN